MAGLDASIILQGRSPNILGAMAQGLQIRAAHEEMARGNALMAYTAQNAEALAAREPNALAGYMRAGATPEDVANLQSSWLGQDATRQNMDFASRRMTMDEETMRQRRDAILAQTTADQRAQAHEEASRRLTALGTYYRTGDEAGFNAAAQRYGFPDISMADWPAAAAEGQADLDWLKGLDGPDASERQHLEDPNGVPRWVDDGSPVFPGVEPTPDPSKALGPNGMTAADTVEAERNARKDWEGLQPVQDFAGVANAYSNIVASAQQRSASGDTALITGLQKLLDPNSVVREQEFATAANVGGLLGKLQAAAQQLDSGEMLTDPQREQIVGAATAIYREAQARQGSLRGQYADNARSAGLNPDNVLTEYRYRPTYRGAPPFEPVARPMSRPGGPGNAPPPTNQIRPTGQLSQGTQGTGTAQTASPSMPAPNQAATQVGPVTIPSVDQVVRMSPQDLDTVVKAANAAGVVIPREVRDAIRARLLGPSRQGEQ